MLQSLLHLCELAVIFPSSVEVIACVLRSDAEKTGFLGEESLPVLSGPFQMLAPVSRRFIPQSGTASAGQDTKAAALPWAGAVWLPG